MTAPKPTPTAVPLGHKAGKAILISGHDLADVAAVLKAGGMGFENVVKSTVFITDMADFPKVNEVYKQYFSAPYPARSCVAVKALPLGCNVEIEVIAVR